MALSGTEIELAKFVCQQAQVPSAKREADADQWRDPGFQPKRNKKRGKQKSGRYPIEPQTLVCLFCVFVFCFHFHSKINEK